MYSVCKNYKSTTNQLKPSKRSVVDDKHHLMMCWMSKVGGTSSKVLLLESHGYKIEPKSLSDRLGFVHVDNILRKWGLKLVSDLNDDHLVTREDVNVLLDQLGTGFGDANLDGRFDSLDFITVFQAAEYEDGVELNSGWSEGDWSGDGEFTSFDLVIAFQETSYFGTIATALKNDETNSSFMPLITNSRTHA